MKNKILTLMLALASISAVAVVNYQLSSRTINDNYSLKFSTRSTDGTFSGLKGTVNFSPDQLESSQIDISIDASSINTGNKKKDEHANSSDWLDTEKYPEILFTSKSFKKDNEQITVTGDLTLHGVTKSVSVPFTYSDGDGTFKGSFVVNRSDYGVTGVGMKAKFVGEEIEITFNIPTSLKNG
jgi:polyisoprenoid-binding protein YceI